VLEIADVEMLAIDADAARLPRVGENLARLGLASSRVRLAAGDAREPASWWDGRPFDRVLVDAPCTASGVVRRHPDGKWLRRESDIAAFALVQRAMLEALWPCVARGGRLLYATCSVFRDENEALVAAFCAARTDALRESLTLEDEVGHEGGQLLPSLPGAVHNHDGFFYALLRKA
jgi:16S rRNA (cytosine967-C5)-methyltransferase